MKCLINCFKVSKNDMKRKIGIVVIFLRQKVKISVGNANCPLRKKRWVMMKMKGWRIRTELAAHYTTTRPLIRTPQKRRWTELSHLMTGPFTTILPYYSIVCIEVRVIEGMQKRKLKCQFWRAQLSNVHPRNWMVSTHFLT